jgi:hypothetical protein
MKKECHDTEIPLNSVYFHLFTGILAVILCPVMTVFVFRFSRTFSKNDNAKSGMFGQSLDFRQGDRELH